jgi:hypothetical protein
MIILLIYCIVGLSLVSMMYVFCSTSFNPLSRALRWWRYCCVLFPPAHLLSYINQKRCVSRSTVSLADDGALALGPAVGPHHVDFGAVKGKRLRVCCQRQPSRCSNKWRLRAFIKSGVSLGLAGSGCRRCYVVGKKTSVVCQAEAGTPCSDTRCGTLNILLLCWRYWWWWFFWTHLWLVICLSYFLVRIRLFL